MGSKHKFAQCIAPSVRMTIRRNLSTKPAKATSFVIVACSIPSLVLGCGAVVAANSLYEGEYTRNFEGEEDTSQVGAAYDPLMPGAENLKTVFVANSSKALKTIQQRQRNIEDNLSNVTPARRSHSSNRLLATTRKHVLSIKPK